MFDLIAFVSATYFLSRSRLSPDDDRDCDTNDGFDTIIMNAVLMVRAARCHKTENDMPGK